MKATDGEVAKVKTAYKGIATKPKAKKPKGGNTTKKSAKKKASSAKKKTSDGRKAAQKKKGITDTDNKSNENKKRRSDRNRNSNNNINDDDSEEDTLAGDFENEAIATDGQDGDGNKNKNEIWEIYEQNGERIESDASWNENYRRLQEFHSTHGHSGVPINWSAEPQFADWVSLQRQLFREIHSGYRIANIREEGRWKRLQVLKFPLNYEKWHWRRKYNELTEALNGKKYGEDVNLPASLKIWVNRQKYLLESGTHVRIASERRGNLEKLGVIQRDSNDASIDW